MVALSVLLPLLVPGGDSDTTTAPLLATLHDLSITTDAELLFTTRTLPPELEALRPKIQTFLAAEGRSADLLYTDGLSKGGRGLTVSTGCENIDKKLLDGGWKGGDVVELVGSSDSDKTFIALQTVLRHLASHPSAYALWLDTTGTFSAELAVQILQTFDIPPINDDDEEPALPPLDRLIVAKTFDLSSAIQAVQSVRNNGFPKPARARSESERKEDKPSSVMESEDQGDLGMQVDQPETIEQAAKTDGSKQEGPEQTAQEEEKPAGSTDRKGEQMQLTFIVIDSITVLFRNILSGVTTEGHAKMVSFMRLLRSLSHSLPCITLLTNTITTSTFPTGLSAFNTLQLVKPSLGPSFSYLCDWTVWIGDVKEAFPEEERNEDVQGRVMEVWRSRRALGNRWIAYRSDGVRFLD